MIKINICFLMVFLVFFISGCSQKEVLKDPVIVHGIEYIEETDELYTSFFDINNKIAIKIDIQESELALIQSDYVFYSSKWSKSPVYRKCNVTISINEVEYFYEEVGIRMKGNTSRTNFYSPELGIFNLIHYKLSFNETFDNPNYYSKPKTWSINDYEIRKNRTFASMSKLDLKWNKNFDETHIRDYWTYEMFRANNILAPKLNNANVKINYRGNDENLGVFCAVEDVDNRFLERRLASKHIGGDLYKVGWDYQYGGDLTMATINRIGIEDEELPYFPIYDLKTNKKTSNFSLMKNLIQKVNSNDDLEKVINISYYLTFEALSYLSGNPDDLRNHYNNYYIYFLNDTSQAIFIPYDYDRTFGITKDWNPSNDGMTSYSPYSLMTTMGGINDQKNPLVMKTVVKGAKIEYISTYRSQILNITSGKFFNQEMFDQTYLLVKEKYEDVLMPSIELIKNQYAPFSDVETYNMDFNTYIKNKIETIDYYIERYS